jgi:hypothetical protein
VEQLASVFGEVQSVTEAPDYGMDYAGSIMVSFYDVRHAQAAATGFSSVDSGLQAHLVTMPLQGGTDGREGLQRGNSRPTCNKVTKEDRSNSTSSSTSPQLLKHRSTSLPAYPRQQPQQHKVEQTQSVPGIYYSHSKPWANGAMCFQPGIMGYEECAYSMAYAGASQHAAAYYMHGGYVMPGGYCMPQYMPGMHYGMMANGYGSAWQQAPRLSSSIDSSPEMPSSRRGSSESERSSNGWRNSSCGDNDPVQYHFNPEECRAAAQEDMRCTLMIRNIPNKYTQKMLLDLLDAKLSGRYDFFYLPIDFKNRCNLGYAFVNFRDADAAACCYEQLHGQRWSEFNSRKICEITYARVQGRDNLIEHFRNSRFPCDSLDCLPVILEIVGGQEGTTKRIALVGTSQPSTV